MIEVNVKLWSWIIATIIFIGYNIFFNKKKPEGMYGGYTFDSSTLTNAAISVGLYMVFWIGWLIAT